MPGILINLLKISHKNGLGRQLFQLIFKNDIGHFPLTHGVTFGKSLNLPEPHLKNVKGWGRARSALTGLQRCHSLIP